MNSQGPTLSSVKNFLYGVYGWMALGLTTTAVTSYVVAEHTTWATTIASNSWLLIVLVVAQLGIAFGLSLYLQKLSPATARILFLVYAFLTGIMLSSIFLVYSMGSIAQTFFITAGMFGAMSVYGYVTQRDLSSLGSVLTMGLVGVIIASVVNMYFKSSQANFIISIIGVGIFTLLTAYDTQKIKAIAYQSPADDRTMQQLSVFGAFILYLDFLNLFLYLLQVLGKPKDQ